MSVKGEKIEMTFINTFTIATIILMILFILLFIGISIIAIIQKIGQVGYTKQTNANRLRSNDKNALEGLIKRINRNGNISDRTTPRPLITLEEFFNGNNDYASIGYNFHPKQPSPQEFYALLLSIRKKPEVHNVLVQISDQEGPENWPFTELIWIITSAESKQVEKWLGKKFHADNLLNGFPESIKVEKLKIPDNMNAIGVWWD
jgi:hypothetical protein